MMKRIKLMTVLLASLLIGACSSDDSSNAPYTVSVQSEAPEWQMDWTYNQELPSWTEPDASVYGDWTTLKVKIEDTLMPYASEGDQLALFVNGELRGLADKPVQTLDGQFVNGKFLLKVFGNESGKVTMSLRYYCKTLKHIFTLTEDLNMDSDLTLGIDTDFMPLFTLGPEKYPVVMVFDATSILAPASLNPATGDRLAVFVGEECRGICVSPTAYLSLFVYGREVGESITVKYYQAASGKLYTFSDAAVIKPNV